MYWPRGRVWGGSSSLNAMVYIRGHPLDYDNWEDMGAHGWNYQNCLPYFKKAQNHELERAITVEDQVKYENMISTVLLRYLVPSKNSRPQKIVTTNFQIYEVQS